MLMGNRFFAAMVVLVLLATAVAFFLCRLQPASAGHPPGSAPAQGAAAQPIAMAVPGES